MASGDSVTLLLRDWKDGDATALDRLMPIVYAELHRLASRHMRGERAGHTLRPTELVAEAYLRLSSSAPPVWNDRLHFFAVAARNMRQILVDHARKRDAAKRGDPRLAVELDEGAISGDKPAAVLALDEALTSLAKLDERRARTIELVFFAGLSQAEIAELLGVHVSTVARDLRVAEAWLRRELAGA